MSRCKSCNVVLSGTELTKTKDDGSFEDLCNACNYIVFLDVNDLYIEHHEYQFGDITEGSIGIINYIPQLKVNMND